MGRSRDFWRGSFIGIVLGLAIGVLLAPDSGQETRRKLKRGAQRIAGDLSDRLETLSRDLGTRVQELKDVARNLGDEAKVETQSLVARAEVLKQDLQSSTKALTAAGRVAKDETVVSARRLMDEGATLMNELEDVTKRLLSSAKTQLTNRKSSDIGEAERRVEELERNGQAEV